MRNTHKGPVGIIAGETTSTYSTSPANCWGESYSYDQWANLTTIGVAATSYNGCIQESLSVSALSNNRLSATGFSYDASGDLLGDGINTYGFNAESEIKSATGVNYTYDGDGDRVQKSNGKIYWYGAGTEILDESDSSGNITDEYVFLGGKRVARRDASGNVIYYVADFLGTSRVVTNATGGILDNSDFYPFGGQRILSASSGNTYKFEGKERDTETNNDDFGARYYSSQFGRWLSPDWSAIPAPVPYANLTNPQTLNLYAMVGDNPETFADLDGHEGPLVLPTTEQDCALGGGSCTEPAQSQKPQNQQAQTNDPTTPPPPPTPDPAGTRTDPKLNPQPSGSNTDSSTTSSSSSTRTPAKGPPDTTVPLPGGTDRTYGPDGRAVKAVDSGHPHDPEPHAHDWDWSGAKPQRGGRRDLTPEEQKQVDAAKRAIIIYLIVSEGSRILFPPRNLVPVP